MAIFVYSGTGNSLAAAKQLAKEFDLQVVHITDELAASNAEFSGEMGIVIFPTYGYGMPMTVKRFILHSHFNFEYLAVLTTIGSHHGGALAEAIRDFKKSGSRVHYTKGIKSVENYVHIFGWKGVRRADEKTQKQSSITAGIADDLRSRVRNRRFPFRPGSMFVAWLLRRVNRVFARRYKILPTCNGCGVCRRVCPANAITIGDDARLPKVDPKKCEHCQACLQLCPRRAIKFGRIHEKSPRYLHKDVTVDEMLKRE